MAAKSESHTGRNIAIGCGVAAVLLIPIVIVIVFLAGVFTAINPAKQFAQANDTKRRNDSLQILNAIWQYSNNNSGTLPTGISETPVDVATICADIIPTYMNALPTDPKVGTTDIVDCSTATSTGYVISQDPTSAKVTVKAPQAELMVVEVSR